jgi:hypothetical protein
MLPDMILSGEEPSSIQWKVLLQFRQCSLRDILLRIRIRILGSDFATDPDPAFFVGDF